MSGRFRHRVIAVAACGAALAGVADAGGATVASGRYEGLTAQSQFMKFTVTADRRYVVQVAVGTVVMQCGNGEETSAPVARTSRSRRFKIDSRGRFRATPARQRRSGEWVLKGRIQGRRATGTVRMVARDSERVVTCDSGTLSWSTKRVR